MKNYVNFEGLKRFYNNLFNKFSVLGHKHTKDDITDITDLEDLIVSDDGNGNVSFTLASLETLAVCDETRVVSLEKELNTLSTNVTTEIGTLKTDVSTLKSVINDNDILVCK